MRTRIAHVPGPLSCADARHVCMCTDARYNCSGQVECFRKFQLDEPGTHVSVVGKQMEAIMRHGRPRLRYFVGPDAVASTVVGCLPTGLREFLLRNTLMGGYTKTPRFMD